MDLAHDSQRRHIAESEDVLVGPFERGPVIEHQQHAGDRFDQEQEERDAAHAPGVGERDSLLFDRDRVQVQEEVGQHHHHPVAPIVRRRVTEDALPDLRSANVVADRHRVGGLRVSGPSTGSGCCVLSVDVWVRN